MFTDAFQAGRPDSAALLHSPTNPHEAYVAARHPETPSAHAARHSGNVAVVEQAGHDDGTHTQDTMAPWKTS